MSNLKARVLRSDPDLSNQVALPKDTPTNSNISWDGCATHSFCLLLILACFSRKSQNRIPSPKSTVHETTNCSIPWCLQGCLARSSPHPLISKTSKPVPVSCVGKIFSFPVDQFPCTPDPPTILGCSRATLHRFAWLHLVQFPEMKRPKPWAKNWSRHFVRTLGWNVDFVLQPTIASQYFGRASDRHHTLRHPLPLQKEPDWQAQESVDLRLLALNCSSWWSIFLIQFNDILDILWKESTCLGNFVFLHKQKRNWNSGRVRTTVPSVPGWRLTRSWRCCCFFAMMIRRWFWYPGQRIRWWWIRRWVWSPGQRIRWWWIRRRFWSRRGERTCWRIWLWHQSQRKRHWWWKALNRCRHWWWKVLNRCRERHRWSSRVRLFWDRSAKSRVWRSAFFGLRLWLWDWRTALRIWHRRSSRIFSNWTRHVCRRRIWHRRSSRIFSNWTRHVCRLRIWHRRSSRIFGHSNWTSYLSRLTPGRWSLYPWSPVRIRPNWSGFCRWRRQSFHHNFRKRRRRFFGRCFFNRRIFRRRGRSNSRNVFKRPFFRNWRAFPRNGFDWRCFPRNRFHWHNVLWKIKKTRLSTAPFRLVQNVLVKIVQVTNEFVDPLHIRLRCITTLCWSRSVQFGHRASELEDNLSKCL